MQVTNRYRRLLGVRASAYVEEHYYRTPGGSCLVPDMPRTPDGIVRALTRVFGRPTTRERGELAYWDVTSAASILGDA